MPRLRTTKHALFAVAIWAGSTTAHARAGGIAATSCVGCHSGGGTPGSLTLSAMPASLEPGQLAELTLTLTGPYAVGGAYISSTGVGELQTIAEQGLRKVSSGLVHERPKPATDGSVQFRFGFLPPAEPGAVRFSVYALGGNGNDQSTGDTATSGVFDFVYGCSSQTYYLDGDGDGAGRTNATMLGCVDAAPAMFVATAGDCDDYDEDVHPGAAELCNQLDDNCDGQVDENVVPVELWPDADGDGYYDARTEKVGTPKMGCDGTKGFAALPGDCQPMNPAINPRAEEICNNLDDDCDGDVDERVRPTCGEGWCRRESSSCDAQFCRPGEPEAEKCNFLDDDCDGEIDEDANMCPNGQLCDGGLCVTVASSGGQAGSVSTAGGSSGSGGASGGASNTTAPRTEKSSGCALGAGRSEGALAALAIALCAAALRRRQR
ncbi:MAG TPA: putative metal-binding motif-containing protein [Polyangiaceae bacterium]|nr:putative metal-binding motif-containing protein [Polyangiaceae bacterium]